MIPPYGFWPFVKCRENYFSTGTVLLLGKEHMKKILTFTLRT